MKKSTKSLATLALVCGLLTGCTGANSEKAEVTETSTGANAAAEQHSCSGSKCAGGKCGGDHKCAGGKCGGDK